MRVESLVLLACLIPLVGLAAGPSFYAPNDFGAAAKIRSLAAVAGSDWREVAEKNRSTGLEKMGSEPLAIAISETARKYAGADSLDVSKVPLAELGEIAEAALRGGTRTEAYGWALLRSFFESNATVSDPAAAARLLAGIERGLAGVVPADAKGERVTFSPRWSIATFQTGTYRTTLPGGGLFESSWKHGVGLYTYELRTTAKKITCCPRLALGIGQLSATVNGKKVEVSGGAFTVEPDENGVAKLEVLFR